LKTNKKNKKCPLTSLFAIALLLLELGLEGGDLFPHVLDQLLKLHVLHHGLLHHVLQLLVGLGDGLQLSGGLLLGGERAQAGEIGGHVQVAWEVGEGGEL